MKSTKGKYAQKMSKRFTLMMIPDSSAKIRKLHVPYWALSVFGVPILCILGIILVAAISQTRLTNLVNLLDHSEARLSEAIDENGRLSEALSTIEIRPEAPPLVQVVEPPPPVDYSQEMAEMLARLDEIDGMKQGIIGVFNDLAALETLPFLFDEATLRGGVIRAQGGAYPSEPEDFITELEGILLSEEFDMQALYELADDLETYFRALPMGWPVSEGNVGSEFGYRVDPFTGQGLEMHEGIDISVPVGTEVHATAYGVVTFAGWHTGGYGFLVTIEHDFDFTTYYAHNSEVLVTVGDEVARGQVVALSGNTGRSTSPHLHYEVRNNGIPVNPRGFLS